MLKVTDHKKYRHFDYESEPSTTYQLGDVLLKKYDDELSSEIGVVIQTFSDGDFRTDMWGMSSYSEVLRAKLSDVKEYRPDLLSDLIIKEADDLPPPLGSGNQYIVVEIAGATKEEVKELNEYYNEGY